MEVLREIFTGSTSENFTEHNDVRHSVFEQPSNQQAQGEHMLMHKQKKVAWNTEPEYPFIQKDEPSLRTFIESSFASVTGKEDKLL